MKKWSQSNSRSTNWLSFLPVLLLVFVYGAGGLYIDTVRPDESTTLGHIGALEEDGQILSLTGTIESLGIFSPQHPPLYYLIANVWGQIVQYETFSLRALSLFLGVIALAGAYRLGKEIVSHEVGWLAGFILGTNVVFVFYLHELREYALMMLASVLLWLVYVRMTHKSQVNKPQLALLLGITVISLYTNYTVIFLLVAMGVYHLLFVPKNRIWWQISLTMGIAGIAYLPWVPTLINGFLVTGSKIDLNQGLLMENPQLIATLSQFWGNGLDILFFAFIVFGVIAIFHHRESSWSILIFLLIMIVGFLLLNAFFPYAKRVRYLLTWLIPFSLTAGIGITLLRHWKILVFSILAIWLIAGTYFGASEIYSRHMGSSAAYTQYQKLLPILRAEQQDDDYLIEVVYSIDIIRASKQGKRSISAYYLDNVGMIYDRQRADDFRPERLKKLLDASDKHDYFWLVYFPSEVPEVIEHFRSDVLDEFVICKVYGGESNFILERYVRTDKPEFCNTNL